MLIINRIIDGLNYLLEGYTPVTTVWYLFTIIVLQLWAYFLGSFLMGRFCIIVFLSISSIVGLSFGIYEYKKRHRWLTMWGYRRGLKKANEELARKRSQQQ
jgi:uncharacterized RDD family membrane protein YckC